MQKNAWLMEQGELVQGWGKEGGRGRERERERERSFALAILILLPLLLCLGFSYLENKASPSTDPGTIILITVAPAFPL